MADLNLCVFIGRLGRDPELKHFPSGDANCSASIAVSKKWKDKQSGEQKEHTVWVPLAFNGKTAELFCQYARKGAQIRVNGEFSTRKFTKDNVEQTFTEIRVQDFQLLGARPDGAPPPAQAPAAAPAARNTAQSDDIPF